MIRLASIRCYNLSRLVNRTQGNLHRFQKVRTNLVRSSWNVRSGTRKSRSSALIHKPRTVFYKTRISDPRGWRKGFFFWLIRIKRERRSPIAMKGNLQNGLDGSRTLIAGQPRKSIHSQFEWHNLAQDGTLFEGRQRPFVLVKFGMVQKRHFSGNTWGPSAYPDRSPW